MVAGEACAVDGSRRGVPMDDVLRPAQAGRLRVDRLAEGAAVAFDAGAGEDETGADVQNGLMAWIHRRGCPCYKAPPMRLHGV